MGEREREVTERKELGKITAARMGFGGYQDAMVGLTIAIGGNGWAVHAPFVGAWADSIKPGHGAEWNETHRERNRAQAMIMLERTLVDAKKRDVSELVGTPVEVTFEGMTLKSWRVLTEVL